jgi:hypothetical protein
MCAGEDGHNVIRSVPDCIVRLAMSYLLNQTSDIDRNSSRNSFVPNVTSSQAPAHGSHPSGGVPRNERASGWRSGTSNAPSVSNSDTLTDQPDDTGPSVGGGKSPLDLQYCMLFPWISYVLLKWLLCSVLSGVCRRWPNSFCPTAQRRRPFTLTHPCEIRGATPYSGVTQMSHLQR